MPTPSRLARSKSDLKQELKDQLQLLQASCRAFDEGIEAAGKQISVILRVLLHLQGRSRALLDQLGYRTGKFYSSGVPLIPGNMAPDFPLLSMIASVDGARYVPKVSFPSRVSPRLLPFTDWWMENIIKDGQGRTFSRMSLVSHVADTDGGAHVDPGLTEDYQAFSRDNSLGWVHERDNTPPTGRPHLACMRQIAHEVLSSLHDRIPEFQQYSKPVIPISAIG